MRWTFILAGIGLLLTGSYVDNLRGLLLPEITQELGLNYSHSSWFFIAGTIAAIGWNLGLIPLSKMFSKREIILATCSTAIVLMGSGYLVHSFVPMVALGFVLGTFITILGSMSNLFVLEGTDHASRSKMLCLLHLMYGVGSFFGPVVGSILLARGASWPSTLLVSWIGLIPLCVFAYRRLPKVERHVVRQAPDLGKLERSSYLGIVAFAIYISGEVLVSSWLSTYLVESRGMTVVQSAPYVTGFFGIMALTRGLCFLTLRPAMELVIIIGAPIVALGMYALGWYVTPVGFSLMGILGPFFPLLLSRMTRTFPKSAATIVLVVQGLGQICLASGHFLVGRLTDVAGVSVGFLVPPVLLLVTLGMLSVYFKKVETA